MLHLHSLRHIKVYIFLDTVDSNQKLLNTYLDTADVTFPATTRQIKAHALRNTKVKRVKLPEGVTAIGSGAFENCRQLEDIYIPRSCDSIAADAFSGVTDLVIYGKKGSQAETYAQQHGFDFIAVPEI